MNSATRSYVMRDRADSVARTRAAILRAMLELALERLIVEVALEDVAARAGVSVRTVLRHFGSRDGLLDAAVAAAYAEVDEERRPLPGDAGASIHALIDHYERRGDFSYRINAQEADPRVGPIVDGARRYHREWVRVVFGPDLPSDPIDRESLTDLLVVATDVFAWKLLRRDRGLDRATTEMRMLDLVGRILSAERRGTRP